MKYEWLGLREFARRLGRHHHAVQKAISDGRVPAASVRRDERGRVVAVDFPSASIAWRLSTDPSQALRRAAAPVNVPDEAPCQAPPPTQASAPATAALEVALVALPAMLERIGIAPTVVTIIVAEVRGVMEAELRGRGVGEAEIAEVLGLIFAMAADEREQPGTWTS